VIRYIFCLPWPSEVDGRKKKEDSTKGLVTLAGLVKLHIVGQKNIGLIGAQEAYTSPICFQHVLLCVSFFKKILPKIHVWCLLVGFGII
jgi:hypothetical protein